MYEIYVSGALTSAPNALELKTFYENIAELCRNISLSAYVPHLNTDPINNPNVSPRLVFETDKHQVTQSDLVIAYIGVPSTGVGMELAYAEVSAIPIILMYEEGKSISRFPRGIPGLVAEIQFTTFSDALAKLKPVLSQFLKMKN